MLGLGQGPSPVCDKIYNKLFTHYWKKLKCCSSLPASLFEKYIILICSFFVLYRRAKSIGWFFLFVLTMQIDLPVGWKMKKRILVGYWRQINFLKKFKLKRQKTMNSLSFGWGKFFLPQKYFTLGNSSQGNKDLTWYNWLPCWIGNTIHERA